MMCLGSFSIMANDRMFNPDAPLANEVVLWVRILQFGLFVGGLLMVFFATSKEEK